MKSSLPAVLGAGLAALLGPVGSSAQASIHVAGGLTAPLGEYSRYAETGWITQAGFRDALGDGRASAGADLFFGRNNHEPTEDGNKSFLYGATGTASYAFVDPEGLHPFVFVTAGLLAESFRSDLQPGLDASELGVAAGGGAGIGFPVGDMGGHVSAWFLNGFRGEGDTRLFGVTTGLTLPLAGF